MIVAYVDTSALAKLLVEEAESASLRRVLVGIIPVTSVLAAVELTAVARRRQIPGGHELAAGLAGDLRLLPVSEAILRQASSPVGVPSLRTLDLLHLLTARAARDAMGATTLIAYDQELVAAARAEAFTVLAPA